MSIIPNGGTEKITVPELLQRKSFAADSSNRKKISCLTAYDYPSARIVDEAGVDVVLVGDSVSMVVLGADARRSAAPHKSGSPRSAPRVGGGRHAVRLLSRRHE
jgi:hypothetical protein